MSVPFFLGAATYQVTTHLAVVKLQSGVDAYVYRDGILPADTVPAQVESMLAAGLIRKIEAV